MQQPIIEKEDKAFIPFLGVLLFITSLGLMILLASTAHGAGNGTVSISPTSSQFDNLQTSFSRDTTYGALDRNVIVVWDSAGTTLKFIGKPLSYSGSSIYMMTDAMSPKYLSELGSSTVLAAGTYKAGHMSLGSACCTNAQVEGGSASVSAMASFSSGYYETFDFTVIATTSSTSTTTSTTIRIMSPELDQLLIYILEGLIVIGTGYGLYRFLK